MIDFSLAAAHHVVVFALAGLLFAELVLVRAGLAAGAVKRLAGIDTGYGLLAFGVIVVGVLRVLFGDKGWDFYSVSHAFWTKMGLFLVVAILSIIPTLSFRRWQRAAGGSADFLVPRDEIATARRFIHIQLGLLLLIPIAAAAMARGF